MASKAKLDDAQQQYEAIVKMETDRRLHIEGGLEPAHRDLGLLLAVRHKPKEAIEQLDKAIELQPKLPDARRHKAWLLATYPDDNSATVRRQFGWQTRHWSFPRGSRRSYGTRLPLPKRKAAISKSDRRRTEGDRHRAADAGRRHPAELEERLELFKSGKPYHAEPQRPSRYGRHHSPSVLVKIGNFP